MNSRRRRTPICSTICARQWASAAESLGVIISTQAANDQHPLSQMIDDASHARRTIPSVYVQLAHAPADADIFDEATWFACNEALGKFLDLGNSAPRPNKRNGCRVSAPSLKTCGSIGASMPRCNSFPTPIGWSAPSRSIMTRRLVGKPCYAGLDLSHDHRHDGAVFCIGRITARCCRSSGCRPMACSIATARRAATIAPGAMPDCWRPRRARRSISGPSSDRLAEIDAEYDLKAVAYDRAFIKTFNAQCEEEGVKLPLVEYGQGYVSMSPAVQILEAAVLDKRMRHGGHPILRWQVSNAAIEMDPAGNRKVSKKRAIGHVDGLIALLMALGVAGLRVEPPAAPKYQIIFV